MTIYLVFGVRDWGYGEEELEYVFSTKEKAEKYMEFSRLNPGVRAVRVLRPVNVDRWEPDGDI